MTGATAALGALNTALVTLAKAIMDPEGDAPFECCPTKRPCKLPCVLNQALARGIPELAELLASMAFTTPPANPDAVTIITAVQAALTTLTGTGCLPEVLSPCVPVTTDFQCALLSLVAAFTAISTIL